MDQIAVLLAVYNGEKFIREQIASIMAQSYPNLHLYIRDNASEDGTGQAVQDMQILHPGRITFIPSSTNIGVIGNFSALLDGSKAPYTMLSDADDIWQRDKVLKTYSKMQELESRHGKSMPLLVHTDLTVVDRNKNLIHPSFWRYSNLAPEKGQTLERQLVQNDITGCTTLVNRPLLDAALPVPEEAVMHDWWLGLVAALFGIVATVNEPTMLYRQHGNNDTGAKRYGLISYINRMKNPIERKKITANIGKRFRQAEVLLSRFNRKLDKQKKKILTAFLELEHAAFFKKRLLMLKYGFYKRGFLRNAAEFLPMELLFRNLPYANRERCLNNKS